MPPLRLPQPGGVEMVSSVGQALTAIGDPHPVVNSVTFDPGQFGAQTLQAALLLKQLRLV
ncbi:MAG: hypothetical protein ACXWD8_14890 [Mycobacterium sp.]